jgi:hypothetical protein
MALYLYVINTYTIAIYQKLLFKPVLACLTGFFYALYVRIWIGAR